MFASHRDAVFENGRFVTCLTVTKAEPLYTHTRGAIDFTIQIVQQLLAMTRKNIKTTLELTQLFQSMDGELV